MIVKVVAFKSPQFGNLLEYMTNEKKKRLFEKGKSFAITHNMKGNSIDKWVLQFKENEQYRNVTRKDSTYLSHEILSWNKLDSENLTIEKMEQMAREYIQMRNPNGMYVAVPHYDKDHYHVHIAASGVEYRTGKSLRLSKTEFGQLKKDIQDYQLQKFPELSKSVVEHGKKEKSKLSEKEYQMKMRTGRETQKELLTGMLKTCYKKAESKEDFYNKLKECGLKTYERGGKVTGVIMEDTKHRFKGLGYEQKHRDRLDKSADRGKELREMRSDEQIKTKQQKQNNSRDNELNEIRQQEQGNSKSEELNETNQHEQNDSRDDELREIRDSNNEKSEGIEIDQD